MSQEQLVHAYVRGDVSRRTFIRRLVALGVSLGAAMSYADLVGRRDTARALPHAFYDDCAPYYEGTEEEAEGDPPTAETLAAVGVTHRSAVLRGFVDRDQSGAAAWFEWGETAAYGERTPRKAAPDEESDQEGETTWVLTGLDPETTYHYRVSARNWRGCAEGEDRTFTTDEAPPPPEDPPPPERQDDDDTDGDGGDGDGNGKASTNTVTSTGPVAGEIIAGAPPAFAAIQSTRPRRLILDVDGVTSNLVTARRRRRLGIEVTCSDAATVEVTASITALVRRAGRRPAVRQVKIASGQVTFPLDGDTKQADLAITRRGLRLLGRRSRVTVELVAVAVPAERGAAWRTVRGAMLLTHPRRRRR